MEPAASRPFSLPAALLLSLLLSLFARVSAQFTVVGPADPILAMVGDNITLSCHLSPEKNAEDMEVRWFRSQFSPAVLVYKGGLERAEEQSGRDTEAQFTVVGPADPILAMVGGNITLSCHLSPEKNAEDMEVRWFRSQFSPAVLVYKGGLERAEEQMEDYRGRTTFVSKDISKGSVALVIHNVTAQEDGFYRCYFQEGRSYDEAILHLMVAGLGSKPLIEMKGHEDRGIRLECTSGGWYPEPRVVWRDPDGEVMPALEEAYTADADGLFTVTTAVIIVDSSVRNMSCSINNTLLGQKKETMIFIPGQFSALWRLSLWRQILSRQTEAQNGEWGCGGRVLGPEELEAKAELRPCPLSQEKIQ
ncbi:PREDICTED: butyrophilin subfamily 2 member A2-like [Galeopterus variegatus]|uniref:Butyrophilin subfamily 2 member A2-like n=1 Tax=Galeopterus variegatus TaxID=482537 RepID=A0ABM0QCI6_GALVR|nr:PREDICTED: butyrophilin subfamily 2 member A2-like [Galeopterus variegatus]